MLEFVEKYQNEFIISIILGLGIYFSTRKAKANEVSNIIIGDSQVPYIQINSKKYIASFNPKLWKSGVNIYWLIEELKKINPNNSIKNVAISIGTNGSFNTNDPIDTLFKLLRQKFPNANFYTIKGSWGWGGNKDKYAWDVDNYYALFEKYSTIINTAIGYGDPHQNKNSYYLIGQELDKLTK